MNFLAASLAGAFLVPGLFLLVYWGIGLGRIARTRRALPSLPDGLRISGLGTPRVCVLVPAHNEARVIEGLVAALRAQDYPAMSVLLCLDRCTDGTADLARRAAAGDERFRIIESSACPDGWVGKPYVLSRAAAREPEARSADMLLFLDADTLPAPGAVRASVALAASHGLDLMSLITTLTFTRWFEYLVQPAAALELMVQYPLLRANRRANRRAFANGQFLLFRREVYDAIGGHGAVKDELLEDLAFARLLAVRGNPVGVYPSDGMLVCRMYGTWAAFRSGWKRIYIEAAKRKPRRLVRAGMRVRTFGTLVPVGAVVALGGAALLLGSEIPRWIQATAVAGALLNVAGLAAWGMVMLTMARLGRAPLWTAAVSWTGAWVVGGMLNEAATDLRRGRPVEWAGRAYQRTAR